MTRPLLLMSGRLEARVASGPLSQWLLEQWDHGHELPSAARAAIVLEELPPERTEPLAGADAVRVLWEMTGVPFTDEVRRVVSAHVAALAGRLETVALISGRG